MMTETRGVAIPSTGAGGAERERAGKRRVPLRLALVNPSTEAYSETFVQTHRRRLDAEVRAQEETARRAEEEVRLAEAAALEEAGMEAEAEQAFAEAEKFAAAPIQVPIVVAPRAVPKMEGISFRENWSATVEDKRAAVAYILEHWQHLGHLVEIIPGALNRLAQQRKSLYVLPGTTAHCKKTPICKKIVSGSA